MATYQNPTATKNALAKALSGLHAVRKSGTREITLRGSRTKIDELLRLYRRWYELHVQAEQAVANARSAAKARDRTHTSCRESLKQLRWWAEAVLGEDSALFSKLGFPRRKKPRELTAAEKARSAAKSAATRRARRRAILSAG
jgi:hypothetical protein